MNVKEIMAELGDFVSSKPADKETQRSMVVALTMVAATIIAAKAGAKTDNKSIREITDSGLMAMIDATAERALPSPELN